MTLVDTSVWIDHLRRGNKQLAELGIGWIDAHLLVSALISHVKIFTLDKAFRALLFTLELSAHS